MNIGTIDELSRNVGDMALKRRLKTIIHELNIESDDIILECGCGDGFYIHLLSRISNNRIFGCDIDINALRSAKKNLEEASIQLLLGNVTQLPYKDKTFNKIILTEVLEHVPNDSQALEELYRVLKDDGILVITVPNHNYPFLWDPINKILEVITGKHIVSGFWAGIWNQHLRLYHREEIRQVVENNNFKILRIEGLTHYCVPFNHLILNLFARLLRGGRLPSNISSLINKFEMKNNHPFLGAVSRPIFYLVNTIDKLNNNIPLEKSTVSIFLKIQKNK